MEFGDNGKELRGGGTTPPLPLGETMFQARYPDGGGGKRVKLKSLLFADAASVSATAVGTGLAMIPVYWTLSGSSAGSAAVWAGTSGSELIRIKSGTSQAQSGYFWDDTITPNKTLVMEVGAMGVGAFNVWYVVKRIGAGDSGTGL